MMNDNKPDFETVLHGRIDTPAMRDTLCDDIIARAAKMPQSQTQQKPMHRFFLFKNAYPKTMMAMAACFVFGLVMVGGFIDTSSLYDSISSSENNENTVIAMNMNAEDIDLLYDWEFNAL